MGVALKGQTVSTTDGMQLRSHFILASYVADAPEAEVILAASGVCAPTFPATNARQRENNCHYVHTPMCELFIIHRASFPSSRIMLVRWKQKLENTICCTSSVWCLSFHLLRPTRPSRSKRLFVSNHCTIFPLNFQTTQTISCIYVEE